MIAEYITTDGEVISKDEKSFFIKLLNNVPEEELNSYFLKKNLLKKVKTNHIETNGSSGINIIQMKSFFSFEEIEQALQYLEQKNQIEKREGINNNLYFLKTKNKL